MVGIVLNEASPYKIKLSNTTLFAPPIVPAPKNAMVPLTAVVAPLELINVPSVLILIVGVLVLVLPYK